jgi:hypothetical protein
MRLLLYETAIGVVPARNRADCRHLLKLAGVLVNEFEIKVIRRPRGGEHERFKGMGPDELRRERIKALKLPPDSGALFAKQGEWR